MQLELPKAVPMEASGHWGRWLTPGARVQVLPLLPQGPERGRKEERAMGLFVQSPASAAVPDLAGIKLIFFLAGTRCFGFSVRIMLITQ